MQPGQPGSGPSDALHVVRRLPRPAALLLVLGMLFLPFLTMSCSSPIGGEMGAVFSGWDSTLGTEPEPIGLAKGFADEAPASTEEAREDYLDAADRPEAAPEMRDWAILTMVSGWGFLGVVLVGVVTLLLLPSSRMRSVGGMAFSLLAGALLLFNHGALRRYVHGTLDLAAEAQQATEPSEFFPDLDVRAFVSVESNWGLWFTLAYLSTYAAVNLLRLLLPAGPFRTVEMSSMLGGSPKGDRRP